MTKIERTIQIATVENTKQISLHLIAFAIAEQYKIERGNAKCKAKKSTANC